VDERHPRALLLPVSESFRQCSIDYSFSFLLLHAFDLVRHTDRFSLRVIPSTPSSMPPSRRFFFRLIVGPFLPISGNVFGPLSLQVSP